MVMKKTFLASLFLIFSLALFFTSHPAKAQEKPKGFTVNPFFQDVTLEKDQAVASFNVAITNNTENLVVLKLSVLDFGTLDESGGVAFLGAAENLTNKYALASWLSLEKDGLVLDPDEKQSVKITIQNKESLSPGGHYAAILAKVDKDDKQNSEPLEVAFDSSFSSLIFARKIGGEIYELALKSQEVQKGFIGLPESIRLRFQNSGNVHIVPRGIVKLIDPLGREVGRGIINEESGIILPETFRVFKVPLKNISSVFIPGKYIISTEYRYDGREAFETEQTTFSLIPWPFLAGLVLIIAGIIFWVRVKKCKAKKANNLEKSNC